MLRHRSLARLVIVSTFTLICGVALPDPVEARDPDGCSPNSSDRSTETQDDACIHGFETRTRGYITAGSACLEGRPGAEYIYRPHECGSNGRGIEYIAQARAAAYLDKRFGGDSAPNTPGVSPDIQWELSIGSKRADITYYDRHELGEQHFHVYEFKLRTNSDFGKVESQVDDYIKRLNDDEDMGGDAIRGWILDEGFPGPHYVDYFRVEDPTDKCAANDPVIRTFQASSTTHGIVVVDELDPACASGNAGTTKKLKGYSENLDEFPSLFADWLAVLFGDPHLVTADGLKYDFQAAGEFVYASSERHDFQIQARFVPQQTWSILDRVALQLNDHTVEFDQHGAVLIDGKSVSIAGQTAMSLDGEDLIIHRTTAGDQYEVIWNTLDDGPRLLWTSGPAASAQIYVPQSSDSDLNGLIGNADGDPFNDMKFSDGTQLPAKTPESTLYGAFADSWRVTNSTSLFTYASGQDTNTFTDRNFPPNVITIDDLSASQINNASPVCASYGVAPGPQFEDCIVDVVLTGNNEFAAMATRRKEIAIDPAAATATAAGDLSVDFEPSVLPNNVRPAQVTDDPAAGSFAGPFTGTGSYRFYVPSLPAHLDGTLNFDVLVLGDWAADPDLEQLGLQLDRADAWSMTPTSTSVSPTRSGVLAGGQPFTVYSVSVPFTHSSSQIEAVFGATGLGTTGSQAFGIDNVALHVNVVPPQTYDVSLPVTVADGSPAAGAGRLETPVSQDEYRFTATAGQSVYLAFQACPGASQIAWRLVDDAGREIRSGTCFDAQIDNLAAGTYRFVVNTRGGVTGTYHLQAFVVPPPVTANPGPSVKAAA